MQQLVNRSHNSTTPHLSSKWSLKSCKVLSACNFIWWNRSNSYSDFLDMKVSALTLSLCYVLSVKLLHKTNNGSNNLKKILIEATTENCSLDWLRCIKYWSYNKTWKIRLFFFISLPHSYESNILWARYCYTPTEHIWITKKTN